MKKSLLSLLLMAALYATPSARADMACSAGGPVTQSANGNISLSVSDHGCQAHPDAVYTVSGGSRNFEFSGPEPRYSDILVSNTGRSVLFVEKNPRADRASVVIFRDGARLGSYSISDLLGGDHNYVSDGLFVKVSLDGLHVVISSLQDEELTRNHLRDFRFQASN